MSTPRSFTLFQQEEEKKISNNGVSCAIPHEWLGWEKSRAKLIPCQSSRASRVIGDRHYFWGAHHLHLRLHYCDGECHAHFFVTFWSRMHLRNLRMRPCNWFWGLPWHRVSLAAATIYFHNDFKSLHLLQIRHLKADTESSEDEYLCRYWSCVLGLENQDTSRPAVASGKEPCKSNSLQVLTHEVLLWVLKSPAAAFLSSVCSQQQMR